MKSSTLTQERLQELFFYDANTGVFVRRVFRNGNAKAGVVVGYPDKFGHLRTMVEGDLYSLHRLAWLYVNGRWPSKHIDHIDGNPANNQIANLREATVAENGQNLCNRSGFMGATWNKSVGRWQSQIKVNGKSIYLGLFDSREGAHSAYLDAKKKHHEFQPVPRGAA